MKKLMLTNRIAVIVIGLLCLSQSVFGILMHNGSNDQDYIDYGSQFSSVNWVEGRGSMVFIEENIQGSVALCSAHQFDDWTGESVTVGTGSNKDSDPGNTYTVSRVIVHEDYTSIAYSPDLCLLYFEEEVAGINVATRFTGTDTIGSLISMVGYGDSGTPATGWQSDWGQKRGAQGYIDQLGAGSLPNYQALSDFDYPGLSGYLPLGGQGAPGDSGGGWFTEDGELMGIMGFYISPANYGQTGALRVSQYNDWIDDTMAAIPEPATITLICTFGGAVLFIRRRVMM